MASQGCKKTPRVVLVELVGSASALCRTGCTASEIRSRLKPFSHYLMISDAWIEKSWGTEVLLWLAGLIKHCALQCAGFWSGLLVKPIVTWRPGLAPVHAGEPLGAGGTGEGRAEPEQGGAWCWACGSSWWVLWSPILQVPSEVPCEQPKQEECLLFVFWGRKQKV